MSNEISTQSSQVMNALTSQLENGSLTPEQLPIILDAQERILDRQARQDFNIAMSACQSEMPTILKAKYNEQTRSKFEDLEQVNKLVNPIYTKHGFAVSFDMGESPIQDYMRIMAEVVHSSGWSKTYHYDMPPDNVGIKGSVNKTMIHASSSTISYGRRYLLKMIFNLTTSEDVDNDAQTIVEFIDEDQINAIKELMRQAHANVKFLKYFNVDSLDKLPVSLYEKATKLLEERIKKNADQS